MNSMAEYEAEFSISHVAAQVETVATTLTLAEQNHAEELKRVCLEFASRNLSTVMCSEGYQHMISSCPQLQVSVFDVCCSCATLHCVHTHVNDFFPWLCLHSLSLPASSQLATESGPLF